MSNVVIDVSLSLDGFIAGPGDGPGLPLGARGGRHLFGWYFGGEEAYQGTMFRPAGVHRQVVADMFQRVGAMLTGRRTYEIAHGWNGEHPVNAMPVVIMTHRPPPDPPRGKSRLVFVTEGIAAAVATAKTLAQGKEVGIAGASVAQQALAAGLVDQLLLHVVPILLGDGVRLFAHPAARAIRLRRLSSLEGADASHHRYAVLRD